MITLPGGNEKNLEETNKAIADEIAVVFSQKSAEYNEHQRQNLRSLRTSPDESNKKLVEGLLGTEDKVEICEVLYPWMIAKWYNDHDRAWIAHVMLEIPNPTESMRKISAIEFKNNAINVWWVNFARENLKVWKNTKLKEWKDYFIGYDEWKSHPEFKDEQYFTCDAAMMEAKAQNKKIPTKEDYKRAAQACPGEFVEYDKESWWTAVKELCWLLWLNLSGQMLREAWQYSNGYGYIRSSSEKYVKMAWFMRFNETKGEVLLQVKDCIFPVRPLQD